MDTYLNPPHPHTPHTHDRAHTETHTHTHAHTQTHTLIPKIVYLVSLLIRTHTSESESEYFIISQAEKLPHSTPHTSHTHERAHADTHTHTHTHTRLRVRPCVRVCKLACVCACVRVCVCLCVASHISETCEAIAITFDTVTASVTRRHHVLIILTLTFIREQTDLNHESNKCSNISNTFQAMAITFAVKIVRLNVYIIILISVR